MAANEKLFELKRKGAGLGAVGGSGGGGAGGAKRDLCWLKDTEGEFKPGTPDGAAPLNPGDLSAASIRQASRSHQPHKSVCRSRPGRPITPRAIVCFIESIIPPSLFDF